MSDKSRRWIIALGYVGFIYATLSLVRGPVNFLRDIGLLKLSLGTIFLGSLGTCLILLLRRTSEPWRIVGLLAIFGIYFLIAQKVRAPEEQIHFFEYGLVGILFARAVQLHTSHTKLILAGSLVLGILAGIIDEIIQGALPNRVFDVRDILLNVLSVGLGLVIFSIFQTFRRIESN